MYQRKKRSASAELPENLPIWIKEKHLNHPLYIDFPSTMWVFHFNQLVIERKLFDKVPDINYIIVNHNNRVVEANSYIKDIDGITKIKPLIVDQHHPCKYRGFIHLLSLY